MTLMEELREIARKLDAFDVPSANEQAAMLGALIYYIDTRLNLEPPPEKTQDRPGWAR